MDTHMQYYKSGVKLKGTQNGRKYYKSASPKRICWSPNPLSLTTCLYLEVRPFQIQLVQMRSYWSRVGTACNMPDVLQEEGHVKTNIHKEYYADKRTGMMHLQAKEILRLLKLGEKHGADSLYSLSKEQALLNPWVWALILQNGETINFCCVKPSVLRNFITAVLGIQYKEKNHVYLSLT